MLVCVCIAVLSLPCTFARPKRAGSEQSEARSKEICRLQLARATSRRPLELESKERKELKRMERMERIERIESMGDCVRAGGILEAIAV